MDMDIFMNVEDLAKRLNISNSTVKKYYLLVEERGYKFRRNIQGHVNFSQKDFELFKLILNLKNRPKTTVKEAIDEALNNFGDEYSIEPKEDISNTQPVSNEDMTVISKKLDDIEFHVKQQNSIIEQRDQMIRDQDDMVNELISSNKRISKMLNDKKEENDLLRETLKENEEIKNLLLEMKEKEENKWWKFW